MKNDVEEELRVNVGYSKCKRARRKVLDAYFGAFATEFSKLKAYSNEMLRSNLGSIVKVVICRDDLKEGMRVFKRLFVCLYAYKKRPKG